jgi:hypothetical protein
LLSPQLLREKIDAARNAQTSQSFGNYGGSLGLSTDGDMEKKEAGRVLRSKDIVKTTEYEEWFVDPTGEYREFIWFFLKKLVDCGGDCTVDNSRARA